MTVPGIASSSLAVASAPERSLQSAMSPAPTRIAALCVSAIGAPGPALLSESQTRNTQRINVIAVRIFFKCYSPLGPTIRTTTNPRPAYPESGFRLMAQKKWPEPVRSGVVALRPRRVASNRDPKSQLAYFSRVGDQRKPAAIVGV